MKRCYEVSFNTPDKCILNGLWFGGQQARVGFVFIHGLSSSVFAHHGILLTDETTMALYFNNRGHDELTGIKQIDESSEKGYSWKPGGKAHEIFTECVYDIQGAIDLLKDNSVEDIYLVGHSTGCQKSIYYLSRKANQDKIKGVVLLCPLSDYASAMKANPKMLKTATARARDLVKGDQPHELLPENVWPDDLIDAQRFLSLYSQDSEEEIFNYASPGHMPLSLQKVTVPTLVVLAARDEYGDRAMEEIRDWFKKESRSSKLDVQIVDSLHNLIGKESEVSSMIHEWQKDTK